MPCVLVCNSYKTQPIIKESYQGNPSSTTENVEVPMYHWYDFSFSASLFTQSELPGPMTISKITIYVKKTSTASVDPLVSNNQTIKMCTVGNNQVVFPTNLRTSLLQSPDDGIWNAYLSTITTVKSNFTYTISNSTQFQAYEFTLDTPYAYNGSGSLILAWENRDGSYISGTQSDPKTQCTSNSTFNSCHDFQDNTYPSNVAVTRDSTGRMNVKFTYT